MLRTIIFFVGVLLSLDVLATAQAPDYLIYDGEKYPLHVNPLEELFQEKQELRPDTEVVSSGNWRGYIATFAVKDRTLFVSDITISKPDPDKDYNYIRESVIEKVFPNESVRKMDWYSGLLVVPLGERVGYVHLSYASQYEQYLLIRISKGVVQESAEMSLEEYMNYKVRQFDIYKTTSDYEALYKELDKDSEPGDDFDLEGFIFQMGGFTHKVDIPFKSPNKSMQPNADASAD